MTEDKEADESDEDEEGSEEPSGSAQKKNKVLPRGPFTPKPTHQDIRAMIQAVKDKDKAWRDSRSH